MESQRFLFALGDQTICVFLQGAFATGESRLQTPLHAHSLPELHYVPRGEAVYLIGQKELVLQAQSAFLLPENTYHKILHISPETEEISFQLQAEGVHFSPKPFSVRLDPPPAQEDFQSLSRWVMLSVLKIFDAQGLPLMQSPTVGDDPDLRRFRIAEFLNVHYHQPVTLEDLAELLHLSPKQSERTVNALFGKNFKALLTGYRLEIAEHLMQNGTDSLEEIARAVGFSSYNGFWKAFGKMYGLSPKAYLRTKNTN